MNETTAIETMATPTQVMPSTDEAAQARSADVRAYVTAVRSWLADLPGDEVEDLTAGMEADLGERAAETGERLGVLLGEPEAYAAELRAAAGLAPRPVSPPGAAPTGPGLIAVMATSMRSKGDGILTRWPWLRELRPTWWLARGAVLGWLVALVLGTGRTVLLPAAGAALSLWIGMKLRDRGARGQVSGVGLAAANVLALVALLPMLTAYTSGYSSGDAADENWPAYPVEVAANGEPVRNLYAYDAAGNRLDGVRLFDHSGKPIMVDVNVLSNDGFTDLPVRESDGMPDVALDVFPLRWPGHDAWSGSGMPWTPPLVLAPVPVPVPGSTATATAEPGPSLTPTPTSSASPSVSPSASPTAVPSPSP